MGQGINMDDKRMIKDKKNTDMALKENAAFVNKAKNKRRVVMLIAFSVLIIFVLSVLIFFKTARHTLENKNIVINGKNVSHKSIDEVVDYNGKKYHYKEGLINIVILGADNDLPVSEKQEKIGDMGQTDAIYLVSIDTNKDSLRVYAIPRDSMGEIEVRNESGQLVSLLNAQLALQYNFALNCVDSSKLSADAVSKLMYYVPVNRVCVFNSDAIGVINDAVGGVEITIENDFTDESGEVLEPEFYKDNTLKLTGEQAVTFVRERDCSIFKSAMDRVSRQEQYIGSLVDTAKSKLKKNPMLAISILNKLKENDCIYTDISVSEFMYIAQLAARTHFSMDDVITIPGEVQMGEEFEEYHTDSVALKKMILENFYNNVK